jgi:acyl carrier protein
MTEREVVTTIVELLAAELDLEAGELTRELEAKGTELPISSQLMVEIILELEQRYSISLPDDAATADAMRSVRALARRICEVAKMPS